MGHHLKSRTCIALIGAAVVFTACFMNRTLGTVPVEAAVFNAAIYTSNSIALPTSAIAANTCTAASVSPITATGVATTNVATFGWASDPTGVSGYGSTGGLTVTVAPGSASVIVKVCNPNSASITPGAQSINVRVLP